MHRWAWLLLVLACGSGADKRFVELSNEGVAGLRRADPVAVPDGQPSNAR